MKHGFSLIIMHHFGVISYDKCTILMEVIANSRHWVYQGMRGLGYYSFSINLNLQKNYKPKALLYQIISKRLEVMKTIPKYILNNKDRWVRRITNPVQPPTPLILDKKKKGPELSDTKKNSNSLAD